MTLTGLKAAIIIGGSVFWVSKLLSFVVYLFLSVRHFQSQDDLNLVLPTKLPAYETQNLQLTQFI